MGHSLGGLLAQMLIHRGLGAAGVAIDSGAPQGIFTTNPSFVIGNWAAINPLNSSSEAYLMPFEHFQYAFVNGRPMEEQRRAYDEQVVPESLRIARGALTLSAHVDFSKPHAPLLFIAGTSDHIVPAALNRTNYDHYKRGSDSIVDFQEFGGRNHYGVVAGHDWELVADAAIEWAERRIAETSEAR
jgi:pimeloyl-ACP methyl ester carboxylesterase